MKGLDPRRLVFIDETWATTPMSRRYGRSRRGRRLYATVYSFPSSNAVMMSLSPAMIDKENPLGAWHFPLHPLGTTFEDYFALGTADDHLDELIAYAVGLATSGNYF